VTPLYPQKLALTSPTGGGRSVGIVRSRTKATELNYNVDGRINTDLPSRQYPTVPTVQAETRTGQLSKTNKQTVLLRV